MPVVPLMGVCAASLSFRLTEDNRVADVLFGGGCAGNAEAVCRLTEGMPAELVIEKLSGIMCGNKYTSCPDQLARAIKNELERKA